MTNISFHTSKICSGLLTRFSKYLSDWKSAKSRVLLLILVLVAIVQTIYFIRIQDLYPSYGLTTEHFYSPLAVNLLEHGIYGEGEHPNIERITKRPPLHSVFLATIYGILGQNELYSLILNNVFLWITVVLVYKIGSYISKPVGLISAVLFAADPVIYLTANKNQPDILYAMQLSVFLLVSIGPFTNNQSQSKMIIPSLILAAATMTRAVTLYFWLPFMASFIFLRRRLYPSSKFPVAHTMSIFLLIQIIILGGWIARNYTVNQNPTFASEQTQLFVDFFGPLVISKSEGSSYKETKNRLKQERQLDEHLQYLLSNNPGAAQRYYLRSGINMVIQNPISALLTYIEHIPTLFLNYPIASITLFFPEDQRESLNQFLEDYTSKKTSRMDLTQYPQAARYFIESGTGIIILHGVFFKIFYLLSMIATGLGAALMIASKKHRSFGILLVVFVAYMVFTSSFWPTARLRIPILPGTTVLVAYALVTGWFFASRYIQIPQWLGNFVKPITEKE